MAANDQPSEEIMDSVAAIVSSQYREYAVAALQDGPKTPTKVVEFHNDEVDMAHISRALGDLRDMGVVDLLVPEERKKGRIYGLTNDGETAAEYAAEM